MNPPALPLPPAGPAAAPRLIVTRPQPEAGRWVAALAAQGQPALALPLIEIAPLPPGAARLPSPSSLRGHAALMFVSAAAVRAFFALVPPAQALAPGARCWSTGPGTAAALRRAGVPEAAIDTPPEAARQFDSEALWALAQPQLRHGTRVLIVRGGDAAGRPAGRDWLARTLAAAGAEVGTAVVYRRLAPAFDAALRAQVGAALAARDVWLFSSSEAVAHLQAADRGEGERAGQWRAAWAGARAIATHARIAAAARAAGFGRVQTAAPVLADVLARLRAG